MGLRHLVLLWHFPCCSGGEENEQCKSKYRVAKSPIISGSCAENDLQLKAFYESSPPCRSNTKIKTDWRKKHQSIDSKYCACIYIYYIYTISYVHIIQYICDGFCIYYIYIFFIWWIYGVLYIISTVQQSSCPRYSFEAKPQTLLCKEEYAFA